MSIRISAILPVHNGAAHLSEAIASIVTQLPPVHETIVIDDGSTDGSADIARAFGPTVRVVRQRRAGAAAARNAAVALARGEAIAFLDHDDRWPPGRLAALAAHLDSAPHVDIVHGRTRLFGAGLPPLDAAAPPRLEGYAVALHAALIRRTTLVRLGWFDPALRIGEDLDWLLRARERGCVIAAIAPVTLWHRIHPRQMTAAGTAHALAAILKGSLDRRRAAGATARALPAWPPRDDRPAAAHRDPRQRAKPASRRPR